MIYFVLGVLLGAFSSWVISHEYARRSLRLEDMREQGSSLLIDTPISEVWRFISNPGFYRYFTLYDIPEESAIEVSIEAGAAYPSRRMTDFIFIIDYEPDKKKISFGNHPKEWDHCIYLLRQKEKTLVYLYRKFNPYESRKSWWNALADVFFQGVRPMSTADLTRDSLQRIEGGLRQWNKIKPL